MNTAASFIERIFTEAFNQGDLESLDRPASAQSGYRSRAAGERGEQDSLAGREDDIARPQGFQKTPGVSRGSRTGLKQTISSLRAAFPDLHCTLDGTLSEGDLAAARWSASGTHTGAFLGNPATGKPIQAQGMLFIRLDGGRLVENWLLIDIYGLLQQLGIIPG